jgi:hypothetical protein
LADVFRYRAWNLICGAVTVSIQGKGTEYNFKSSQICIATANYQEAK